VSAQQAREFGLKGKVYIDSGAVQGWIERASLVFISVGPQNGEY
jgi:hypothetical protein